jgi:hypothetical protein
VTLDLRLFVSHFAKALEAADAKLPRAVNQRTGVPFQSGIGPHSEAETVRLVMQHLAAVEPVRFGDFGLAVPYPKIVRQRCDLCLGTGPIWQMAIEVKLLRLFGDRGKLNDNMLMHLLSPYPSTEVPLPTVRSS